MNIKLTGQELCQIIDTCKKAGVVEFKLDKLCINFEKPYNFELPASTAGNSLTAGQYVPKEQLAARDIERELDQLDELMLSNPLAYEEALNAREAQGTIESPKDNRRAQ